MNGIPLWASELAEEFWGDAAEGEAFPRCLDRQIARVLPVTLVLLPALRVATIGEWLLQRTGACAVNVPDRRLRACLLARLGHGIIFLHGTDPADELRFSLAHEVAHFLRHYWFPRRAAEERLGSRVIEVLDGLRAPEHGERSHALLANVTIGYFVHLMDRRHESATGLQVTIAEHEANLLAFELLAPEARVRQDLEQQRAVSPRDAVRLLQDKYGLPETAARSYAVVLSPPSRGNSFLQTLGIPR